jgi:anti-sigma B factor antagonist
LVLVITLLVATQVLRTRLRQALTGLASDMPGRSTLFHELKELVMSEAATTSNRSADPDRGHVIHGVHDRAPHLPLPTRTQRGNHLVAVLSGGLDGTRAAAVREQLLRLLRPAASRLVLDLSLVSHIDAGGLAVLVGTERRARLLGGSLRLAAVRPTVSLAVRAAGLDRLLEIFPTVQSAISSPARARPLLGVAGNAQSAPRIPPVGSD